MENLTATQGGAFLTAIVAALGMAWPVARPLIQSWLASAAKSEKAKTLAHVSEFLDFRESLDEATDKAVWEQMRPKREVSP